MVPVKALRQYWEEGCRPSMCNLSDAGNLHEPGQRVDQPHYDDHPPPHFHVEYGDDNATIDIRTMTLTDGYLSPRVLGLVTEWGARHRAALHENFSRVAHHHAPHRLPP